MNAEEFIDQLTADRKSAVKSLRDCILRSIPSGFAETVSNQMIAYVVPHSIYPNGYHCDPASPLPFLSIASQKNHIAIYHMGLYADQDLMAWFAEAFRSRYNRKLDGGKSCIRFKDGSVLPFELIEELMAKMTPADWIAKYESAFLRKK